MFTLSDTLRPLIERDGLKELELPMLSKGCIAATTEGLGLCEYGDASSEVFSPMTLWSC